MDATTRVCLAVQLAASSIRMMSPSFASHSFVLGWSPHLHRPDKHQTMLQGR